MYDESVEVWRNIRKPLEVAMEKTGTPARDVMKLMWSTMQRFFKLLCVSMKVGSSHVAVCQHEGGVRGGAVPHWQFSTAEYLRLGVRQHQLGTTPNSLSHACVLYVSVPDVLHRGVRRMGSDGHY
jgi:hypothetical protein